jgi:prepilin-type N-terminal cleavage/methylation domain-containing protein
MKCERGFTLIECLVCIVILGIGLVGVVGCLTAALLSNQKASRTQLAAALVQDTIEDMRSRGLGSITYDEFPATSQVADLPQGTQTIQITDAYGGDPRLKRVAVEVSWRSTNASTARVRMETVVSNRTQHTGS